MRLWVRFAALAFAISPTSALAADPASVPAPAVQPGDTWVYDRTHEQGTNGFSQQRIDLTIDRIDSETMLVGLKVDGAPSAFMDHITGLDWSQRRMVEGRETVTGRPFFFPLKIGSTWTADYVQPRPQGVQTSAHFHTTYKVVGWEDVSVPAGTFHALKIEGNGAAEGQISTPASAVGGAVVTPSGGTTVAHTERAHSSVIHVITYSAFYYVPEIKYYVKCVEEQYNGDNVRTMRDTDTLVSFKAAH